MTENNSNLCGIIPVYKEKDWTSFDVIGKLRGILHIKRLGHGGTLDPMAEGVLPVFVGKATKCCDIIPDSRKVYKAGFEFGLSTDTQDITGEILSKSNKEIPLSLIKAELVKFTGKIMQLPPMYSAVKVNGKKLYELAREGKTVERTPRQITVNSLEITGYDEKSRRGEMIIDCMKGTYVRTIISDMGDSLGAGGVMTSLERTRSAGIEKSECFTVSQIEKIAQENKIGEIIIPADRVFEIYQKATLDKRTTALYKNGVKLYKNQVSVSDEYEEYNEQKKYRVYGFDGEFLGIGGFCQGLFRSIKNFY